MLDLILGSKTKIKLLRILFLYPQRQFSVTELIDEAKIGKGRIAEELCDLVKTGIIIHKSGGKPKLYTANKDHPLFWDLQTIFEREKRHSLPLSNKLRQLASELSVKLSKLASAALIFGSAAAGTYMSSSDVDLLVVSERKKEVRLAIGGLEKRYGVRFESIVLSKEEAEKSKVLASARRECLWLFGEHAI